MQLKYPIKRLGTHVRDSVKISFFMLSYYLGIVQKVKKVLKNQVKEG